jgi:hypothetical protein
MLQINQSVRDGQRLYSRVYNWKFNQALQYLKDQPGPVKELVHALSDKYGNVGHWDIDDPEMEISKEDYRLIDIVVWGLLGALTR